MNLNLLLVAKKRFCFLLGASSLILVMGLLSDIYLGDEVYHFRFAQDIFLSGHRPFYDLLYGNPYTGAPGSLLYLSAPLWNILLALFWKLTGGVNQWSAQLFQTLYYCALLLIIILSGKKLYGTEKIGDAGGLIVGTVPMVVSFSILFYTDVPALSLEMLTFFFLLQRKYIYSGIFLGLAVMTKLYNYFLIPTALFMIFWEEEVSWKRWLVNVLKVIIPTVLIILPDLYYRYQHFGGFFFIPDPIIGPQQETLYFNPPLTQAFANSSILRPINLIQYFGITVPFLMIIYWFKKGYERRDIVLWVPIIIYGIGYTIFFRKSLDIRYLFPIIPFIVILAGKTFSMVSYRWVKTAIIFLCFLQIGGTAFYVWKERQVPRSIQEGFDFIKKNLSSQAIILYPEENITYWTGRRMQWGRMKYLPYLFWSANPEEMREILEINAVDYILIKKSRIYDDQRVRHKGGYPRSFVEKLPQISFLRIIFENEDLALWEIERKSFSYGKIHGIFHKRGLGD